MARVGRNDPCPCGSGRKAKRCCGPERGPSETQLARAQLTHHARRAITVLGDFDEQELRPLWERLCELPALDLSLLVPLPELFSPALARLCEAFEDDDPDAAEDALAPVLASVDTAQNRARLATAVANLEASGRIRPRLAALAQIDLASRSGILLRSSLIEAVAVATGRSRTPGGLLVAAA